MKILITGIAGFLGSHLADEFLSRGHEVYGIDNLSGGYAHNVPKKSVWWVEDLNNLDLIQDKFIGIDLVVHAACTAYEGLSVFAPSIITKNTFNITSTVLSASIKNNVKKFVYMSSMARYGMQNEVPFLESMTPNPQDPYGIAKLASEQLVKNLCETHGMDYVILVPHNIIGPRQRYDDPYRNVASIMINRMIQGKQPIIYGDGEQMRCFSFISDVVNPIVMSCEKNLVDGMVVNIGPDKEFITINSLANKISKILNFDLNPIYIKDRPREVKYANCSADKSRKYLQYEPKISLEEGLTELINWIKISGPKDFFYNFELEFVTGKCPESWTERLF